MIVLTPLINAVIAVAAAIITAKIVPLLKSKLSEKERAEMLQWVDIGVAAAQQMYHHLDGATRKAHVREFLMSKGYNIHSAEVDKAIEAAVLKLHQSLEEGSE